jgi:hypothetical protein
VSLTAVDTSMPTTANNATLNKDKKLFMDGARTESESEKKKKSQIPKPKKKKKLDEQSSLNSVQTALLAGSVR